jgi:hypothetical protein
MSFLTRPMFLGTLAAALAGLTFLGCAVSSAGAQPSEPPQPAPGAPPFGNPRGGPGFVFQDDFVARLADNLGLPVDTVRSALQQIQPDMPAPTGQPPTPPDPSGSFAPGGPGSPGEFRGPGGPPPDPNGAGFPDRPGGPGFGRGPRLDELASRLAPVLSLPEETVRSALQQTFQEMRPDFPGGQPPAGP